MCGRFTLTSTPESLARRFGLRAPPDFGPRYNVAPGQTVLAVRRDGDGLRAGVWLRWGLVPAWSQAPDTGARWINARIETVAEKPAFRDAVRARRCLVPADAFYEWADHGGFKQPYRIALENAAAFAFAGVWERWRGAGGETLESCAIVTTAAGPALRALHDRMPVLLPEHEHAAWLDPSQGELAALLERLRTAPEPAFAVHPVGLRVNDIRNDDPACAAPAPAAPRQASLF